jgi:hypothetical protein
MDPTGSAAIAIMSDEDDAFQRVLQVMQRGNPPNRTDCFIWRRLPDDDVVFR